MPSRTGLAHVALTASLLVLFATAAAGDSFDYRLSHAVRAHEVPELRTRSFLAGGPLCYRVVDAEAPTLEIMDRTEPGALSLVGEVALTRLATSLSRDGDRLYAVDGEGLDIVDIGDPLAPVLLGSHALPGARHAAAQGDLLLVTGGTAGVSIFDASDPVTLVLLADMPLLGHASLLALFGDRAVIDLAYHGFALVDITDPAAPVLLGTQSPNHSFVELLNVDGLLVVVTAVSGIRVYDPMTGNHATFLEMFDDGSRYRSATASSGRLHACGSYRAVDVFDISQLPQIELLARHDYLVNARDAACHDDLLLVNQYDWSYAWIEPERSTVAPDPVFTRSLDQGLYSLRARGGCLYGTYSAYGAESGLYILDVGPGATGEQLGAITLDGGGWRLALQDDLAYVQGYGGLLSIVDVADPVEPTLVSATRIAVEQCSCRDIAVDGTRAAVGFSRLEVGGIVLVDVSDHVRPRVLTRLHLPEPVVRVAWWHGHVIACTSRDALYVIRMPEPLDPNPGARIVAHLEIIYSQSGCADLVVADGVAWILGVHDLFAVDLATPDAPVVLSRWRPLGVAAEAMKELAIRDGLAYVATTSNSLTVLDVHDPLAIELVGYARASDHARSLAVDDRAAYVAHTGDTLVAWPLHLAGTPEAEGSTRPIDPASRAPQISVYPSPANPHTTVRFSLARAQHATVTVHDLRGVRIAVLADRRLAAGEHVLAWNGRSRSGGAAASGTYVVRLATETGVTTRKLMLVR